MLINGKPSTQIDAKDRGLAYGDGLFSTIKLEYGQVIDWPLHLARFKQGASRLFLPSVDWLQLQEEVFFCAQQLKSFSNYVLKVILTRGSGGRGYSAQGCEQPLRIISSSAYPEQYLQWQQQGIDIVQCSYKLSRNQQLAGLKSLARLEQVLIKQELNQLQAVEGLVCDEFDNVIEGCASNLFICVDGQWITPLLNFSGVAGVMRERIMQLSHLDVIEKQLPIRELQQASCLCLTNALMGVVPVKQYQHRIYSKAQLQPVFELQALLQQGRG